MLESRLPDEFGTLFIRLFVASKEGKISLGFLNINAESFLTTADIFLCNSGPLSMLDFILGVISLSCNMYCLLSADDSEDGAGKTADVAVGGGAGSSKFNNGELFNLSVLGGSCTSYVFPKRGSFCRTAITSIVEHLISACGHLSLQRLPCRPAFTLSTAFSWTFSSKSNVPTSYFLYSSMFSYSPSYGNPMMR